MATERFTLADVLGKDKIGVIFDTVSRWEHQRKKEPSDKDHAKPRADKTTLRPPLSH